MKSFNLLLILMLTSFVSAQYSAPWFKNVETENGKIYYKDVLNNAEQYFANKDIYAKGSGYKQFERWKEIWKYKVLDDGSLPTSTELKNIYNDVEQIKKYDSSKTAVGQWSPLGPSSFTNNGSWSAGQGRINVIEVDPNNENNIYIGAPDGGIWKSTDGGDSWIPLSDNLPTLGISGIAISHANSNTIYISTGDEDGQDTYSDGIYKTTNGGNSWNQVLASDTFNISGEIVMHPTDENTLWVVTNGGLYKTTNGGNSWNKTLNNAVVEIRLKPNNPNTVYVARDSEFLYSNDGGESFRTASNSIFNGAGRIVIDVTPAKPEYVYAYVANHNNSVRGLYRSENSGISFTARNTTTNTFESNQAWYDFAIAVSDINPELIMSGVLNIWTSSDGGTNFSKLNSWSAPNSNSYTHADIHFLKFFNGKLYCGSDGGIFVSNDNGVNFEDKTTNLSISQFYRISSSPNNTNTIAGGLQDNGGYVFEENDNGWVNYYGADGMESAIDPTNDHLIYGFIQFGGNLYNYNTQTNISSFVISSPQGGNWITPLKFNSSGDLFYGSNHLYKLVETPSSLIWTQVSEEFSENIDYISISETNNDNIWIVINEKLYHSTNGGPNFSEVDVSSVIGNSNIRWFEIHPNNDNILYMIADKKVYKSTNAGDTWSNITANLSVNEPKLVIKGQKTNNNNLNPVYLGTDTGIYYYDDNAQTWTAFDTGLPNCAVRDIEINENEGNIVIGTYGRGVWRSPVHENTLSIENFNGKKELFIYPNPNDGNLKFAQNINEKTSIKIYNSQGKLVINQTYNSIDSSKTYNYSHLTNGIYFIILKSDKKLISKKFIVKK